MKNFIKIMIFLFINFFLYGEEKKAYQDPILEFVENAIKLYPDSIWIDPEFLEYMPQGAKTEILNWPKSRKKFEELFPRLEKIPPEYQGTFEDVKILLEGIVSSHKWYVYWKKRGIDYYEWREKVLNTFCKKRNFNFYKFVEAAKKTGSKGSVHEVFKNEDSLKIRTYYYSDVVIEGKLIKIEEHPEEPIYRKWVYMKVNKVLWGKEKKDTIIIKLPRFGTGPTIASGDLMGDFLVVEWDIGKERIVFLTKFPFSKLLSFPCLVYRWKKGKESNETIKFYEDTLLYLYKKDEISVEEHPIGVYEPMYLTDGLKKFKNKIDWHTAPDERFFRQDLVYPPIPYSEVISLLKSAFKKRGK